MELCNESLKKKCNQEDIECEHDSVVEFKQKCLQFVCYLLLSHQPKEAASYG